jgi:hypothetical protein
LKTRGRDAPLAAWRRWLAGSGTRPVTLLLIGVRDLRRAFLVERAEPTAG